MHADSTFVNETINKVKSEYTPDKRTSVFLIEYTFEGESLVLSGETDTKPALNALQRELQFKYKDIQNNVQLLPEQKLGEKTYGIIAVSVSNHRTDHKHSAEMATQSLMGTVVKVLKKKGGWYLVQTPDDYLGWVDDEAVEECTKEKADEWIASVRYMVTSAYTILKSAPDDKSTPVSDLVAGNLLKFSAEEGEYIKLITPDGRTGYLPKSHVHEFSDWVAKSQLTAESIVAASEEFMGVPYLWGGTSSKGVDCSGFTKSVYFMNGLITPRDASQQVFEGELIDTKSGFSLLQPGDLLFFGEKGTDSTRERVTHVGIYIGNEEFIHSSGKVKINSLNKNAPNFSPYRFNSFIRAKRFLTAAGMKGLKLIKENPLYFKQESLP